MIAHGRPLPGTPSSGFPNLCLDTCGDPRDYQMRPQSPEQGPGVGSAKRPREFANRFQGFAKWPREFGNRSQGFTKWPSEFVNRPLAVTAVSSTICARRASSHGSTKWPIEFVNRPPVPLAPLVCRTGCSFASEIGSFAPSRGRSAPPGCVLAPECTSPGTRFVPAATHCSSVTGDVYPCTGP